MSASVSPLLADLNPEQRAAVTHGNGPLLIVAGAGTGKTTVITRRLAWLLDQKRASSQGILTLTFTEKAAAELEERVDKILPYGYLDLWVSTFHAFGERILREHGNEIGLATNFTILTTAQQYLLLHRSFDAFGFEHYAQRGSPSSFIRSLLTHFSRLKDEHITPEEYLRFARKAFRRRGGSAADREERGKIMELAEAYATYERLLAERTALDFGDLITRTLELLRRRPSVLRQYQQQFTHVLVDEFQDTNWAQYELVKLLAAPQNNLTVCGDDDQSIYKFRGASVANILQFKKDFPRAHEVFLIQNYRSQQNILDLSYDFIQLNNPDRLEYQLAHASPRRSALSSRPKGRRSRTVFSKQLAAATPGTAIIRHIAAPTLATEVEAVLGEIVRLHAAARDASWNDFAILVRANGFAEPFLQALERQDIPYQFVAARGLYRRPEILDLVSFLKLLDDYHESPALYRVLSMAPFQIPQPDIVLIGGYAKRRSLSLYEACRDVDAIPGLPVSSRRRVARVLDLLHRHTEDARRQSVSAVLWGFIQDINLIDTMSKAGRNQEVLNVVQLYRRAQSWEQESGTHSVAEFVRELGLLAEFGEDVALDDLDAGPEAVKVMTIHGAKGLEFPYVFIVNLVEQRFPSISRKDALPVPDALVREKSLPTGDAHLQEERRLFYVAMTRAKRGVYLSSADDYGGKRRKRPSRFFSELNHRYLTEERIAATQLAMPLPRRATRAPRKRSATLPFPREVSYSQLRSFLTCPKQYRYEYLLKIPTVGSPVFSFGKSVHATLEAFYARIQQGKIPSKRELLQMYDEHWIGEWYRSKHHAEQRKTAGRQALIQYYDRNRGQFPVPLFLEKAFKMMIGTYPVRGQFDRVDRDADSHYHVIDYKTGKVPVRLTPVEQLQLQLYSLAVEELFGELPVELAYEYIEAGERRSSTPTREQVEHVRATVRDLIGRMQTSDFTATPSPTVCRPCPFRDICEDRAV